MHRLTPPSRDERGAVAVLYAIVAVVLLAVAALAVDIGNTVSRKTNSQTQADFGALAAVPELSTTVSAGMTPPTSVIDAIVEALNNNQPQDDEDSCWTADPPTCVVAADLTDGVLANGEATYTDQGLRVTAPRARVDFGFANILGYDGTYVDADATVNVYSGGQRVMPMYGVDACSYGRQTLTDPANGQVTPTTPTLAHPTDTNNTDLSLATLLASDGSTITTVTLGSTGNKLRLTASKWDKSRYIGFFRDDNPDPGLVVRQGTFWLQGDALQTPRAPYDSNPSKTVELNIPDNVASTQAVWWIRVFDGPDTTGKWSPASEAIPFRVGGAVLECTAGSEDGNFGTLLFPRTDTVESDWLPRNITDGLQPPLTPTVHQWALDNPTLAGSCSHGVDGAVESPKAPAVLRRGTNCVDTDTGLPANAATEGLITGFGSGYPGLLRTANTRTGCDPTGGSSNRTERLNNVSYSFNNEVLSCYLTDSTTSLADISNRNYAGGAVLDKSIFDSPRFFWVPVLTDEPVSGGSGRYSIVDFRPAFITDEQASSSAILGSHTATADNGLQFSENDVTRITVFFFSIDALPNEGGNSLIDFLGVGDPIVRLID